MSLIRSLLDICDLPSQDIDDYLRHFLLAFDGDTLAGVVGLENRGSGALLRSLAVDPAYRGMGIGKALTGKILDHAVALGIREIGLLTTTAEHFFARAGFTQVDKDAVPDFVKASKEYRLYCPSTAVCMVKHL